VAGFRPNPVILLVLSTVTFAQGGGMRIAKIEVRGSTRFPGKAIAEAVGLRPGGPAGRTDLGSICTLVLETGLFTECQYDYRASVGRPGFIDLTIDLADETQLYPVTISAPGVSESELWSWLGQNHALCDQRMPGNDLALQVCTDGVERYLREHDRARRMIATVDYDRKSGQPRSIRIHPEKLLRIRSLEFAGDSVLDSLRLQRALAPVALGADFSEHDFRQLLEYILLPLYRERGYRAVRILKVEGRDDGKNVDVITTIDQGPLSPS
jgi:hypothetical protein